jgi:hypothetical protein
VVEVNHRRLNLDRVSLRQNYGLNRLSHSILHAHTVAASGDGIAVENTIQIKCYAETRRSASSASPCSTRSITVTHFWVYMELGGLAQREVLGSMERFATRVMPKFR